MRLDQSAQEIAYLIRKVETGHLDMQPNFQRGAVWSEAKKRRLIDTILREWYIPPIHIVVNDALDREEVLDGQQRLRAIVDFVEGKYVIDGTLAPTDTFIQSLDSFSYADLPTRVRSRFDRFPITTVRLRDYRPGEPGELFFRLNQLTSLTSAEQRNALFGAARDQIRLLTETLERCLGESEIGFSNNRMNYDDVLSRLALSLELGGLGEKITAHNLEARYRTGEGFDEPMQKDIRRSIIRFGRAIRAIEGIKFNKATIFSWLYFIIDNRWTKSPVTATAFADFMGFFEASRSKKRSVRLRATLNLHVNTSSADDPYGLLQIFNDRSASRVSDVSSVLLRDFCINAFCIWNNSDLMRYSPKLMHKRAILRPLMARLERTNESEREEIVEAFLFESGWGNRD